MAPCIGALSLGNEILAIGNEECVGGGYRLVCFILVSPSHIFVGGPYDFISSVRSWVACSDIYVQCPVDDVRGSCIYVRAGNNYHESFDNWFVSRPN